MIYKMKTGLKKLIVKALTKMDRVISVTLAGIILCGKYRKIAQSDVVVYIHDGGYGHTITEVDIARRIFRGKKLIIILPSEVGRHNWKQSKIWPGIDVIHIIKSIRYHAFSQTLNMERCVLLILRILFGFKKYELPSDKSKSDINREVVLTHELQELLIRDVKIKCGEIRQHPSTPTVDIYLAYWFRSIELYEVLPPVLPRKERNYIYSKLQLVLGEHFKIVTIYMRVKGLGSDGELRCGSGFESYSKSIDYLIEQGYTIFLVGDRSLNECPEHDIHKYYTADRLGLNQDWFNLFAATECKLFIGDPGGGAVLPTITKVPRLMINGYPYVQVLHGYLILFKRLLNANGQDLTMKTCFMQLTYHFDPMVGSAVRNNTEIEIFEAAKELVAVDPDIWLDYIKGNVDRQGRTIAGENASTFGRLNLGPCRLADCQQRTVQA